MPDLKVYAKAIAAFIAGVLANMVSDLANGQAPWPQSAGEWLRYTLTSVGAGAAAYAVPNRPKRNDAYLGNIIPNIQLWGVVDEHAAANPITGTAETLGGDNTLVLDDSDGDTPPDEDDNPTRA